MSTEPKKPATRRRDKDPVKVNANGRLSYWTLGVPGKGERKQERYPTLAEAEARAVELRARLAELQFGATPRPGATMLDLVKHMLAHLRSVGSPEGTVRQYKSDWNAHIGDHLATVVCREASLAHWTLVINSLEAAQAPRRMIMAVARTMGAIVNHGIENGFFTGTEGFATAPQRAKVVRRAKIRAAVRDNSKDAPISLEVCPTAEDVDRYAEAFEALYPGYGARLVWLSFGSGLRLCETLALKIDSIDLATGIVKVDCQLNRYESFPAVAPPKYGHRREAKLWSCYLDVARSLIEDARARDRDRGWLFPRHAKSTKAWADYCGHLASKARAAADWEWTHHWLRHGYASWSLAPESSGGYGLPLPAVSKWLGHQKVSTTQDTYVQAPADADDLASLVTARKPGRKAKVNAVA